MLAVDPATGNRTAVSAVDLFNPLGMWAFGGDLYVASDFELLRKVTLSTGAVSSIGNLGALPQYTVDLTFASPSTIYTSTQLSGSSVPPYVAGVYAANVQTGTYSIISGGDRRFGTSIPFNGPQGIATQSDGMILLTELQGTILSIDPTTGNRMVLSDATHGAGPALSNP